MKASSRLSSFRSFSTRSKLDIVKYNQNKSQQTYFYSLQTMLGLQSTDRPQYPLWEQLVREAVYHMHSAEFREEFYPLVRHDEVHVRLFSIHLWLLADRLKHTSQPMLPLGAYLNHRYTLYVLCGRRFPKYFFEN